MDIRKAIEEKKALLEKAKEAVRTLEVQIEALQSILNPSAFEVALKSQTSTGPVASARNEDNHTTRRTRGRVYSAVLDILKDGTSKNIDEVFEEAVARDLKTTHRSIGSTLSRLKLKGILVSDKLGTYRLPRGSDSFGLETGTPLEVEDEPKQEEDTDDLV